MNADRWSEIERLLDAALERDPDDRAAFLAQACAGDPDLRREVETLLHAEAGAPGFLSEGASAFAAPAIATEPDIEGRAVGPYRLLREVGRGGMGIVYLAERPDLDRQVALKLVRGGLADPALRQRFLHERRILARLEHPHIARLYDAGLDDDGTPYFALEYVEGQPLDAYCDAHRLSLDARLRLFEAVGRAVQHAHQHFVVHRDLKPGNILVTEDGEGRPQVKLLDFGIAKVLAEAEEVEGTSLTQTGRRLLTPAYAAPEQIRGEAVTAATDVYSLGVMLYELLTGRRPYEVTGRGLEGAQAVLTQVPKKPSTTVTEESATTTETAAARATTPERLLRQLQGDLDVICLKALAKEPERRYASAEAFVEDIRRHLEGLPVTARPDTAGYRLKKFVQRHRQGVLAAVGLVALLAAVVAFYTTQLQEQRDAARLEAEKSQEVTDFMLGLFEASDPSEALGDTLTAPELLQRGIERAEALGTQPQVQAQMLAVIGAAFTSLGSYERADSLLQRALAIQRETLGATHPDIARTLNRIGGLLERQSDFEAAERFVQEALTMRKRLYGEGHIEVVQSLHDLGMIRSNLGDLEAADSLLDVAWRITERRADADPIEKANLLKGMAKVAQERGAYAVADSLHEASLDLHRQVYGEVHPETAQTLSHYAWHRSRRGDFAAADSMYGEVLAIQRTVFGDVHPAVATTLNNRGAALSDAGDLEGAAAFLEEALAMWRRLLGEDHPEVSTTLNNLGVLYDRKGDYETAEARYRDALAIRRRHFGNEHPRTATVINNIAFSLSKKGDRGAAEPLYRESLAIRRAVYGEEHPLVAQSIGNLGWTLFMLGREDEAEPLLREAYEMRVRVLGEKHSHTARAKSNLGKLLEKQERFEEAETMYREALEVLHATLGAGHHAVAITTSNLGSVCQAQGRLEEAEEHYLNALSITREAVGEAHPDVASISKKLAELYDEMGKPAEAARYRAAAGSPTP